MKRFLFTITLFLSCNTFAINNDTSNLYQVNLIIFSHITNDTLLSEHWPNELIQPNIKNAIELYPLVQSTDLANDSENEYIQTFQLLTYNHKGLKREANLLTKKCNDCKILLHLSWIQPMYALKQAQWIHIDGGKTYDEQGQPIQEDQLYATSMPKYWEINGFIKIGLSKYFDIYSNLYLTTPESIVGNQAEKISYGPFQPIPLRTFKLIHHQRTRSKEINYFDHPLYGMIIQIMPYKPPRIDLGFD